MLRLAWTSLARGFRRRPLFTLLRVGGLAVSLAVCALIILFVHNERQVNTIFPDADRIYRIDSRWRDPSMGLPMTTMAPVGETLVETYPEFASQARLYLMSNTVLVANDSYREDVMMADTSFFSIFDIPFVRGDPRKALTEPRSVVLTDSLAMRYFGTVDAIGRTLRLETWNSGFQPFTVTGVRRTLPFNSVTDYLADNGGYDIMIPPYPFGDYFDEGGWNSWESRYLVEFVRLAPGASIARAETRLNGFVERYAPESLHGNVTVWLNPISELHLTDFDGRRAGTIRLLEWIAVVLLAVGAINFANLSTARSVARARESGIRQAVGAAPSELFRHFLAESILLALLAAAVATGLAWLLQDVPFRLAGAERVVGGLWTTDIMLTLLFATCAAGVAGGLYPAIVFASFRPSRALRDDRRTSGFVGILRRGLVVVQYAAALVLLIAAGTMWQQFRYIAGADLGFNRDRVLVIDSVPRQFDEEGVAHMATVAERLEQVPGVESASLSWRTAAEAGDTRALQPPGTPPEDAASVPVGIVDPSFARTFGLQVVSGRFFDENRSEGNGEIVLNRSAVRALGLNPDPLGQEIAVWNGPRAGAEGTSSASYTVIGVLKDYHFAPLRQRLGPLAMISIASEPMYRVLSLRLSVSPSRKQVSEIESVWRDMLPEAPFVYSYLDDVIDRQYASDQQIFRVVAIAGILAILIACLGMLGLASVALVRRRREMGIRKSMGATSGRLFVQLASEFSRPVLLAMILAFPVGYVLMSRWLGEFAYAVDLGVSIFVFGAVVTLVLTVLTVAYHAARTARTNPAETLRMD